MPKEVQKIGKWKKKKANNIMVFLIHFKLSRGQLCNNSLGQQGTQMKTFYIFFTVQ